MVNTIYSAPTAESLTGRNQTLKVASGLVCVIFPIYFSPFFLKVLPNLLTEIGEQTALQWAFNINSYFHSAF